MPLFIFIKMKKCYLYILLCDNGSYYIGSTRSLLKRFKEHQMGLGSNYTSHNLPVVLVYFELHTTKNEAYLREMQLKKWSRIKKEALILNWSEKLKKAAECQNKTHHKYHKTQ